MRVDLFTGNIIHWMATLAWLEELHLDFASYKPETLGRGPFDVVPFRRINISGSSITSLYALDCVQQIREMVAHGGELSHLTLTYPVPFVEGSIQASGNPGSASVLNKIFAGVPAGSSPSLRHLSLAGYTLRLDVRILAHLRNLSSLDVSRANVLHKREGEVQFWGALQGASIHLKALIVEAVTSPMLGYLASFSCLEHFTARGERYPIDHLDDGEEQCAKDEAQNLTYALMDTVLPKHKASLLSYLCYNRLRTRAPSYMMRNSILSLTECTKLRSVAFALHELDLKDGMKLSVTVCQFLPNRIL